jgi:hypothetical protein
LAAGIEHFYIYDNESEESVEDYLTANAPEMLEKCTIELFSADDSVVPKTEAAFNKCANDYKTEMEWCAFIDTDEMFTGDLAAYVHEIDEQGFKMVRVFQLLHGSNGQVEDSEGTLFERFGTDESLREFNMSKSIVKIDFLKYQYTHYTTLKGYQKSRSVLIQDQTSVCLHHFITKSLEEYIQKVKRGHAYAGWSYSFAQFRNNAFGTISDEDYNAMMEKYEMTDYVEPSQS